jgi:methionine-rich copper-binding protein CopC
MPDQPQTRPRSLKTLLGTALLAGCLLPAGAYAHAHLKAQVPAADSTVSAAPTQLRLVFSEGVEAGFSQVTLNDAADKTFPTQPLQTAPGDSKTLLVTPKAPLANGDYTVTWRVVSVDTHKMSGSYRFKVGQ